ncbi:MAG: hypothetical protein B7Y80_18780 [Hyphomicrobium sp. 32-62-53]|nr:MAG: hypothetical protein B7Z29_17470 [Hyphomicrobium sp. 12-62-95]OYX97666.1 MAG: hypothetical protein B7Y80_18780 [Hyphomicrobium sp. 32-62-53]
MKRLIALLIIIVLLSGAGIAALGMTKIQTLWSQVIALFQPSEPAAPPVIAKDKPSAAPDQKLKEAKLSPPDPSSSPADAASFDVANISSDGPSVFAGQSAPNARVRVLVDGRPVGETIADENGAWVLIVDDPIVAANPKLSIQSEPEADVAGGSSSVAAQPNGATSAPQKEAALGQSPEPVAPSDEPAALESVPMSSGALNPDAISPASPVTSSDITVAPLQDLPTVRGSAPDIAQPTPVPIPIKFVFRQAAMTEEGLKAADILLAYVRTKKPPSIKLTGHADERGPDEFNLALSAQRLKSVADFLRSGGYTGVIDLVPKGEGEPYTALDRNRLPQDLLYDLDRRVEVQMVE